MEDLTGRRFGAYQIISPFGQGGMATVYKAYQPSMDRFVAIKVLPRFHSSDPEFLGRFEQEAKSLAQLQHPHILPVHDFGESEGYTYFVMPLMQEGTLSDLLVDERLSLDRVNQIISQVGSALDFAHLQGLIHRDVKPSNILLDKSGNCMLMDFGIAKIIEGSQEFTRTGGIIGTPAYMSPEQGSGQKIDHKSDMYSLGIILYEMVTGKPPFEAETPVAVIFKHLHDPLPPPRSLNPDISEEVERVILKSLAKEPGDRYESVKEMVNALSRAVAASERREAVGAVLPPTVRDGDLSTSDEAPNLLDQGMTTRERTGQVQPVSTIPLGSERAVEVEPGSRQKALAIGFGFVAVVVILLVLRSFSLRGIPLTGVTDPSPTPTETVVTTISTNASAASSTPTTMSTPNLTLTSASELPLTAIPTLTLTSPSPPTSAPPIAATQKPPTKKPPTSPPTFPDLIISNLTHSPSNPTTTTLITFTATVKNVGDATAGPSNLVFKVGGESNPPSFAIPSLAPGQSHSVQRQEILSVAQNYQNTATADANSAVAESNEGNNVATDFLTVNPTPPTSPPTFADLIVSNLTHSPSNPTTADTITFTATVKNVGNNTAGGSNLVFKVGGESNPPIFPIPSLGPGQSHSVQRQVNLSVAQNYQITATADATGLIPESNEGNNVGTHFLTVN